MKVTVGEFFSLNVDADCGSEWSHRGWFLSSMVILARELSVPLWATFMNAFFFFKVSLRTESSEWCSIANDG